MAPCWGNHQRGVFGVKMSCWGSSTPESWGCPLPSPTGITRAPRPFDAGSSVTAWHWLRVPVPATPPVLPVHLVPPSPWTFGAASQAGYQGLPPSLLALRQQLLTPTEGWLEITENSLKMPPQQKLQPGYGRETPGEQGEAATMQGGLRLSALRGLGAHQGSTQGSLSHRGHG